MGRCRSSTEFTDQCVDHTVRDAADRGYYPICISDACATHSKERHVNALAAFTSYCQTLTTQEMIGLATRSSSARE
ncbi:cysteine hydrolase family protein [Aurantimonas sp. A3-2-R12]|uniref:cysteine hydrolase family protein n=1 Tax=Aurantimonas sp. A3-2-R12 TaxID=3114362 RepID=UPI002E178D3B|nr:isochorismatase family protein [Aurantimonas sp. A3-2-R12]